MNNRNNDKNKKFTPLNINNVFKGKVTQENQNKTGYRTPGMQNIGKISSVRRVPAPKWVPSIKAETGASENRQIINQASSGWVNSSTQDSCDQSMLHNQSLNKDKNQWTSKATHNKPFFLMGQEFPLLPSDGTSDIAIDPGKDGSKSKDNESLKSKLDDLRNRDNTISASTLNRIDALSISKSSKGDIAATGWAAEDEEPNFDEKIVFSDDESINDNHNWHSDPENVVNINKPDNIRIAQNQLREPQLSMGDTWFEQSQTSPYPQYSQYPMQINMPNQYIPSQQFSQNVINRSSSSVINPNEDQSLFLNSVAEQRNARNMEYYMAIERARQKKMGSNINRTYFNEELMHHDPMSRRSRNTSLTSETNESMSTLVEMGPPGGPPMLHNPHKPHISPMMHPNAIPMISPTLTGPPMIRFTQPPFMMPLQTVSLEHITDPKLMEKWVEFLKQQQQQQQQQTNNEGQCEFQIPDNHQQSQVRPINSREVKEAVFDNPEPEVTKPQPPFSIQKNLEREQEQVLEKNFDIDDKTQKDNIRKNKSLYSSEEDNTKNDNSKRPTKNKYGSNVKEYRSTKFSYKDEYSANTPSERKEYGDNFGKNNDDVAYEDYHVYQQHYPSQRRKDYKNNGDFRQTSYKYCDETYSNDYNYKSNYLKYKSTKVKDSKSSAPPFEEAERENNPIVKKSAGDNQESQYYDSAEVVERKTNKVERRGVKPGPSSYSNRRYDNYTSYKDRPSEARQEYSMGFAVNPKDSQRNYYSNQYNRRTYPSDYGYYSYPANSDSKYNEYENSNAYYQSDKYQYSHYPQEDYPHNPSLKKSTKVTSEQQWRRKDDKPSSTKLKYDNQAKSSNVRGVNRRSDKRVQSSSTPKENSNENDQEEWETASEGGSARSNSVLRDSHRSSTNKHMSEPNIKDEDTVKKDTQRAAENQYGTSNSCSGTWPSYPDDDEHDGSSGSAGGNKTSDCRTNKTTDTPQTRTSESNHSNKDNPSNSSTKECSDSNNTSKDYFKSHQRHHISRAHLNFLEISKSSSVVNIDKLPEVTEDEELLYENVEQFQEVLSKSAKKNRKLEEQRRLKEELELKKLEAQRLKNMNDAKLVKKPLVKKEVYLKSSATSQDKSDCNINKRVDNKVVTSVRDKESTFKKFECNKVSMQIGSWDNSLADDINLNKNIPPKPIGTPASMSSSWNVKVKSMPTCNSNALSNSTVVRGITVTTKESIKPQNEIKNSQASKSVFIASSENSPADYNAPISFPYKNSIFDRSNESKKSKDQLEPEVAEVTVPDSITFDYDVKNISCDKSTVRNPMTEDRILQKTDQQSFNDKINSVKTIWDVLPAAVTTSQLEITNVEIDSLHNSTSNIQDATISRNVEVNLVTPALSINNVCKVKPQLQQDFIKKDIEPAVSSTFAVRSPGTAYLSHNQTNLMPYSSHQFPQELFQDHLHASDALATLLSNNQGAMHINYNIANPHLLESSLLRQNHQDHLLSNKMNFISQSSFYPQPAVTPKLFSNAPGPLNMDISSSHGALPLQHLLLTRQNSLTSMMQSNGMSIPFIQNGQQHPQASLFPTSPLIAPANFSPQLNPFSQGHYSPGNFPPLHHNPQFQQNQQMIMNQQQHQQHMLQNQISHERGGVMNNGAQSGLYNSMLGSIGSSGEAGLTDFNGQHQKHLSHSNIMHGVNGSAIMLPHNLNILMKPHLFAHTTSQYNGFQAPIQSNQINVRNGYENHSNMKMVTELEAYKSLDNSVLDRNSFNGENFAVLPKQREDFYVDHNKDYDNCDITSNEGWTNLRQSSVNNFIQQTMDFQSQRSPLQFALDSNITCADNLIYRNLINNLRDPHSSFSANAHNNVPNQRIKQHCSHDQVRPRTSHRNYDNNNFISNHYNNKAEFTKKLSLKNTEESIVPTSESNVTFVKDNPHGEKLFPFPNKSDAVQRSSFSESFAEDKTQSWSALDGDCEGLKLNVNVVDGGGGGGDCQSSGKLFNNSSRSSVFDNQCQYGYDETQLSSQTAESLSKFDSMQLKKMIMKLREGPVMTFADIDTNFDQGPSRKTVKGKQGYNFVEGAECAGMGFYSRNRALTPPGRNYRSHKSSRCQQHSSSSCGSHSNYRTSKYSHNHASTSGDNEDIDNTLSVADCGDNINDSVIDNVVL